MTNQTNLPVDTDDDPSGAATAAAIGVVLLLLIGGLLLVGRSGSDGDAAVETVADSAAETVEAPTDLSPGVSAAVAIFAGVTGSADGTTALLTGFVDDDAQSAAAEQAAEAVPGIESVDNQLIAVDEGVLDALNNSGVTNAGVTVDGLVATVTGELDTDEQRQPALDAAANVAGVASVIDQLTIAAPTDLSPDVSVAVADFSGVNGSADGSTAILTGFVDDDAQSQAAEAAALAVPGIESVDNQLIAVDVGVLDALNDNGVTNAGVTVDGLVAAVSGELDTDEQRQPTLDAAAAVAGVASVIDQLTIAEPSLTESLNALVELEPVQFASSSAEVLAESFDTLDAAAEIILASDDTSPIEVQGYTDIRGSDQGNLDLSDARAAAVVQALVDREVPADRLTSIGFGGTTQFGEGETDEAYAANRRVVFVPAG